jgi:acyl-CoA reductase-like NAD-dependent aldehyde dehydrogenase
VELEYAMEPTMDTTNLRMLIGGELLAGDLTLDVINPATGEVHATVPRASARQLDLAVAAAKDAFATWRHSSKEDRARCLIALADAIVEHADEFAQVLVAEQGKPLAQAVEEVGWTEGYLRAFTTLDLANELIYEDDDHRCETHYKPLGVVAGIAPWNFPLFITSMKIGAAVWTGNTIIAKPAPTTPMTILMLGQLAKDIFPAGVLNILVDANDLGAALVEHPDVDKVTFTGSNATGKRVAAAAGASMKRVTLELGGNDASIVLDDVDVDEVADKIFGAAFKNAGQVCIAIKRVYAHTTVYDSLVDALSKRVADAELGNGMAPGVQIGPLQNRMQFEKAKTFLESAHADGVVTVGGAAREGGGNFIEPTVVRDVDPDALIVKEEQFAPILPVIRFTDIDDAVAQVNSTAYGLGGSVFSADVDRAVAVADRLDTGTVWINHHLVLDPRVPLGGAKDSGIGVDYGIDGLKLYTQATVVRIAKK